MTFTEVQTYRRKGPVRRKTARRASLKPKITKSLVAKADKHFADQIKKRDGKCLFPNCTVFSLEKLTCSHYFSRAKWGTRYDPLNCIALCRTHHYWDKQLGWEFQKQQEEIHGWDGQYTLYMKNWLGEEWVELKARAEMTGQRKTVLLLYQHFFKDLDGKVVA